MANSIEGFLLNVTRELIKQGGIPASDEVKKARRSVCDGCEFRGKVVLSPLLPKVDGCLKCKCDFETKTSLMKVNKSPGKTNAKTILTGKITAELEEVKCPMGYWAE